MNLFKLLLALMLGLQVMHFHAAQENFAVYNNIITEKKSVHETLTVNNELECLLIAHPNLHIDEQEYQTLKKGWQLAGLSDLPKFIDAQLQNADIEQGDNVSEIVTTKVENNIITKFTQNLNHLHAFNNTLNNIIDGYYIDLNQTPDSKKIWGEEWPVLSWLNDPQHDPIFEYCNQHLFMKPVIHSYIQNRHGREQDLLTDILKNNNALSMQFIMKYYNFNQSSLNNLLLTAVQYYDADAVIPLLLAKDAHIDLKLDNNGHTLLHNATVYGAIKSIPLLAPHIDINQADDVLGFTPLHLAAAAKSFNIHHSLAYDEDQRYANTVIPVLLANGADIHKKDKKGQTPLHVAAHTVNPHAIPLLLAAGAQVNDRDNKNQTPLHAICTTDEWFIGDITALSVISQLVDAGADLEALDNHNKKPGDYSNLLTAVLMFKNRS